jgi:hypothetical protein
MCVCVASTAEGEYGWPYGRRGEGGGDCEPYGSQAPDDGEGRRYIRRS